MTGELKMAIRHVKEWQYGWGTHFGVKLLDLIAKADGGNRERLRLGFPNYVEAYELWHKEGEAVYDRLSI